MERREEQVNAELSFLLANVAPSGQNIGLSHFTYIFCSEKRYDAFASFIFHKCSLTTVISFHNTILGFHS